MTRLERGLYNQAPALPVPIFGVRKLQKLLVAAVSQKETKEGAGVKNVVVSK